MFLAESADISGVCDSVGSCATASDALLQVNKQGLSKNVLDKSEVSRRRRRKRAKECTMSSECGDSDLCTKSNKWGGVHACSNCKSNGEEVRCNPGWSTMRCRCWKAR